MPATAIVLLEPSVRSTTSATKRFRTEEGGLSSKRRKTNASSFAQESSSAERENDASLHTEGNVSKTNLEDAKLLLSLCQ